MLINLVGARSSFTKLLIIIMFTLWNIVPLTLFLTFTSMWGFPDKRSDNCFCARVCTLLSVSVSTFFSGSTNAILTL